MSDEKSFQYAKRMFPLFRAIVKFCSTKRPFKSVFIRCQSTKYAEVLLVMLLGIYLASCYNFKKHLIHICSCITTSGEQSIATAKFDYCSKKREHSIGILKVLFPPTLVRV